MAKKAKTAARSARRAEAKDEATFLAGLKVHGQVQEGTGPLKPGVTHVLERAAKGKVRLVRKRFSAV
jgi:hypothetical protein